MNYNKAFFEMLKLRGEELYPVSLPYAWYSVSTAAGIVLMDKSNNYELMLWWLSWVRTDTPDPSTIEARTQAYHPRNYDESIKTATKEELEKILKRATVVGSLTTTKKGAVTAFPSQQEIARYMK